MREGKPMTDLHLILQGEFVLSKEIEYIRPHDSKA